MHKNEICQVNCGKYYGKKAYPLLQGTGDKMYRKAGSIIIIIGKPLAFPGRLPEVIEYPKRVRSRWIHK